ncbi:helix-turn-helix transcriptional regulator [Streptomyces sp. DSM 44915]|uniref:Helix-turn-helix transcriptional regulator n=1 Tax=Streptomyces chisholmiae TaxID=3075540 RepID=A0ABU2JZW3_9ACTN|nr:helix-turn-helix transcriptional regulator [Streptomyces sp. DSM 44915]MDT0270294.1 helix-turn-helix transcriptional regulator [Streptomyces sp. DSM 44915]
MTTPSPTYRLPDPDLMRTLMRRTGTGAPVSIRELAAASGLSHGTVGNLLTGVTSSVSADAAHAIADRIGVDVLVLWVPAGRATGDGPLLQAAA